MSNYQELREQKIHLHNIKMEFIMANTSIVCPPLVPEIELYLAHEALPIWQKTEEQLGEIGLPPPFWAFAWAGGQALARYILDNPELVAGKYVLDLAAGSGLVGIAAMKSGAKKVLASDIDTFSLCAIKLNSNLNRVKLERVENDLLDGGTRPVSVVLVGDMFYEKDLARRCIKWLRRCQNDHESDVLIGDPGRSYLPKDQLLKVAEYSVPVSRDLEDAEIKQTAVWRLA